MDKGTGKQQLQSVKRLVLPRRLCQVYMSATRMTIQTNDPLPSSNPLFHLLPPSPCIYLGWRLSRLHLSLSLSLKHSKMGRSATCSSSSIDSSSSSTYSSTSLHNQDLSTDLRLGLSISSSQDNLSSTSRYLHSTNSYFKASLFLL